MTGPFYKTGTGLGLTAAGGSAAESSVAPVTISEADAVTAGLNLASQGVALYAQDQRYRNRYGGTRSGRPDPNLARFSEEVQIALRNKEQFGEGRFKMDMNRIVQNFGSAGQPIDEDMLDYFEQTTGLPSDTYFGVDPVEKFKATQIQTPEIQARAAPLIAAGMNQEEALNQALEEQQTFTRLAEELKQTDTENAVEYMAPKGGQQIQQDIIQHFRDTAYSRLSALVNTGKATEQDARIVLSNYQALLATPKMQIPSGVSPEVRTQEVAARNNLKGSIETIVKLLDAGEQGQSLLQQITQNPKMSDGDKKNMLSKFVLLSATDPFLLTKFMGIEDMNDLVKGNTSLGKLPPSNFELGNLNSVTASAIATAPPGSIPPPETIVPPDLSDAIRNMTPDQLVSYTRGNAKKASFPGYSFNSQEDVTAFATSIYSVAQGLTAPQQNRLRTIDDLGKLLNRNIFKNLDSLDKVDPEQAALLRASLSVGLTTELGRRKVQLSSIEKSLVGDATADGIITAKFNQETGKYELTPEFINSQTPEDMKSFQVGVEYAYGGDLAKGAENNFVRLTTARSPSQGPGDASKVVSNGNLIRIEDAQRNRRATAALGQFYSSLNAGGELPPLAQEFSDPSAEARRVAATVAGSAPMDQGQTRNQRSEVTLTPTNRMTSAGRRLYETSEGELVSEKTTTVQDPNSKLWYNIPTVNNGTMMSVDEAAELYLGKGEVKDVETGRVIQSFETVEEAVDAARARSQELNQGQTMDEGDGRSLLQRGLEMIFSPAASSELTPELRAQLEAVRTRLPPTRPEGLPGDTPEVKSTLAPPMEAVSRVIVKGESPLGYGDWNRGTSNGIPLNKAVAGKTVADNNIVELTHEEHLARSGPDIKADDPQRLFAIGRYQIIPTTAEGAFKFLGYSKKQKYTPEVQDNMFKYLLMGKRKPLYDYIKDEKGSDKDKAVLEMAKEFASIGVPYDVQVTVNKRKVTRKKGDSYYGQPAPTTPEDIGKQLDALRELYKKDPDALEPMGPKQKSAEDLRLKQAKAARAEFNELTPREPVEFNELTPREPDETPETLTDAQFIEQMSKSLSETPAEKRTREAKARLDARTAYYKSLND